MERNPELWSEHNDRAIMGLCMGNLPAIAAAASFSDTDLLRLAPMFVQLSLRVGLEVSRRTLALENSSDAWSTSVSGVSLETLEEDLGRFNRSRDIPINKLVYVSAHSTSSITLSGPPSLLRDFLSSEPMHVARKLPHPIHGLFHASHLPLPEPHAIIGRSGFLERRVRNHKTLLRSTAEDVLEVPLLKELLIRAVNGIFQRPLDINDDVRQILSRVNGRQVELTSIGPARMSHLQRALKPVGIHRLGSRKLQSQERPALTPDDRNSIAIVGMAGRFPDAQNVDELWKVLIENRDLHQIVPIDRFDVRTHVDPTGKLKNTSLTPYGCFDQHVGHFDASLFRISPKEAAQTDPMQRMMLLTAYEALESAGYYDNGDQTARPRNGTFYGVGADDYRQVNSGQHVDVNYITGGTRAFGPGRVSYHFGWEGPSMTVDTACSASAVAVHQAISSLRLRECDVALAGGANLLTCSDMFAGLSRAKFVCSTGPCKTFDETADGYCRADATATVVLKRFSDSIRDKDNILGVIRSIETLHAGTAISLTHPEVDTQVALFKSVLTSAGNNMDDIDHIELHGTGTQAGDLAEASSVVRLLHEPRPKSRPLTISSVKPNVGHSEAASGVTSLIKCLLMLRHQVIPRHIGIKTRLNPKLPPLDDFNIVIPQSNLPFTARSGDATRRILVNNFNATGGVTAMLLEEHCPSTAEIKDIRQQCPITLSAASMAVLSRSKTQLLEYLKSTADIEISHLSYTLTARRLHHKHRYACVAGSIDELIHKIEADLSRVGRHIKRETSSFSVLVFTGQASSYPGMAKVLFETNDAFRSHLLRSDSICRVMGLPSFLETITNDKADPFQFGQTQGHLALVALEVALASLLESWGIQPEAVIGHSLGEYSALCVSKALSLADTLYLVGKRGLLLEAKCECNAFSMVTVSLPYSEVTKTLHLPQFSECEVACLNAPDQTVVSGPSVTIIPLMAHFKANGIRAAKLRTPYGFHSKQMEVILPELRNIAKSIPFQKPHVPLLSTLLAEVVHEEGTLNPQYMCRQTREPVRFQDALNKLDGLMEEGKHPVYIEVGPGPACLPMIASITQVNPANLLCALDSKKPNWLTISELVTGYYTNNGNVRWDEYHREYLDALSLLQLPSYPFDLKKYWIQYDGDWVIRKNNGAHIKEQVAQAEEPAIKSSTLHRLDSDFVENGIRKLLFTSDLNSEAVGSMGGYYMANGLSECPSSMYVDMALAATSYLYEKLGRGSGSLEMEVSEFAISSNLVFRGTHSVQIIATQRPSDTNVVEISILSSHHRAATEVTRCRVISGHGEGLTNDVNSNAYLYQSRMDLLNLFLSTGQVSRVPQSKVYEQLGRFVSYEESSHGIQEVLLNVAAWEAVAKISLPFIEGNFVCDPRWLDNLIQVPTLVVNYSHDYTAEFWLTCRGWNKSYILLPLVPNAIYRIHVRMQPGGETKSMVGDLHALDEAGRVAAVIKCILFKPVSGLKPNTTPATVNHTVQNKIPHRTDKHASTNSPPTPSPCGTNETSVNGHQVSNVSDINELSQDARKSSHPKPISSEELLKDVNGGIAPYDGLTEPRKTVGPVKANGVSLDPAPQHLSSANGSDGIVDFEKILAVIADEIGVEPSSLDDSVLLDDVGIDSIVQISLTARIQEHLAKPLSPRIFHDASSIAKLRRYFDGLSITQ